MTKYILSLDSGGIRSIIQVYVLLYLERDLLQLTGKTVLETFDFYAGTSGGALVIAALVYSESKTMAEIADKFNESIFKRIFKRSYTSYLFGPFLRPKYDNTEKYAVILNEVGIKTMADTDKKVLFTVYSTETGLPKIIKSYCNTKNNLRVADIVDASAAAPGYFPSTSYGIDGAIFASDPTDCAYADALKEFPNEELKILSIGTGSGEYTKLGPETKYWGLIQWATKGSIVQKLIDVNSGVVNYRMNQFTKALGHTYIRIDGITDIQLDNIKRIEDMKLIAKEWYTENRERILCEIVPDYGNPVSNW